MRDFASLQTDQWLRARAAEVLLALALAPAFAWMNPFFSSKQPFLALVGFWGAVLACWFVTMAIVERLLSAFDFFRRISPAWRRVTVIAVAALPMILIAGAGIHALKGWRITFYEIIELYLQIILIGSGVALIAVATFVRRFEPATSGNAMAFSPIMRDWISEESSSPVIRPQDALSAVNNRLLSRLPLQVRGRILCLEMEDHYVRVHTDRGSALVLLRLSDAIAEAEAIVSGRQVHRSWWVSDDAIERFERVGRTGELRLSGGIKAPVSQRYLKLVESACAAKNRPVAATHNAPAAML